MKISIITVCYNAADSIIDTLLSVQTQSFRDIEHIVIDGGSSDRTVEYVNSYINKISYFVSEPDSGIYNAMNKGIRAANGEVIGILNSGDIYAHSHVLERVASLICDNKLDALYADVDFFMPNQKHKCVRRYSSRHFSSSNLAWGWMPAHPSLFLNKHIFHHYGLYREDYKIAADYEFIARVFKDNKINYTYLPEVLVRMSLGGVSTSGWRNTLLLNHEIFRACKENDIQTNWIKLLSRYPAKLCEYFFN